MPLTQLAPPYPIFTDKNGDPLDAGYLYFGVVNLNPETNPIQVYYDSALTQPAAQPLRTSNGYVMRNGSPALIYANSQFSVTVRDKNNALVIYSPVGYGITPGTSATSTDFITYNQGFTGAVDRILTSRLQDYVSVKDFGAIGNRVADDTAAFEAAIAAVKASGPRAVGLYIPKGFYQISRPLDISRVSVSGPPGRAVIEATASFPIGSFLFTYGDTAAPGSDRCTMRDLDIDCNYRANGLHMLHRQFRVYGSTFRKPYDYGIKTDRNSQEIWSCEIEGGINSPGLGIGVFVDGASESTSAGFRFDGSHIDTCKIGLKINEARVARVINSTIQGCTRHIDIAAESQRIIGLVIENNYFEDTTIAGTLESIYINSNGAASSLYYPIIIRNNSFYGRNITGSVAIRANLSGFVEFVGNNVRALPFIFDYVTSAPESRGIFEANSTEPPAVGVSATQAFDPANANNLTAMRRFRFGPGEEFRFRVGGTATIAAGTASITVTHGMSITPERILVTYYNTTDGVVNASGVLFTTNINSTTFDIVRDTAAANNAVVAYTAFFGEF